MNRLIKQLGFTLLELMVAVVVLLAIMVAVGRIFSTTSSISATGQAISETLQQGVAIEQQLRDDISKLSQEGFFAIRSVALANNMKGDYFLLDPSQGPEAVIRCDQLIFFTNGIASPMLNANNTDFAGQGLASMIYYGHGVKFPQLDGQGEGINNYDESDDPKFFESSVQAVIGPWFEGPIEIETRKYTNSQAQRYDIVAEGSYANGTQRDPSNWILCRQAIVLGDDDQQDPDSTSKTVYMGSGIASHTIFPWDPRIEALIGTSNQLYPHVLQGRVDIAATQLDDVRQSVLQNVENAGGANRFWRAAGDGEVDQQELIASLFRWPRVEPVPATQIRYDQSLMFGAIASGCASFEIEWTYDEGVGETYDKYGNYFVGYQYDDAFLQPWWGGSYRIDPDDITNLNIDFDTLGQWTTDSYDNNLPHTPAWVVDPDFIESSFAFDDGPLVAPVPTVQDLDGGIAEYWAVFGYNADNPFNENGIDLVNDPENTAEFQSPPDGADFGTLAGNNTWRYTPWPSSLRITMRLIDRENRLGSGWTYQFVVDLPERKRQ